MRFDTKIAVVVLGDLPVWQKLNVVAFTVSGVTVSEPGLTGEPYLDASGTEYLPMLRQPVLVFQADPAQVRAAFDRVLGAGLKPAVYTRELFATGHDEANRAAVRAKRLEELDLVGFAVRGERNRLDKALKGLQLHG